MTLKGHNALWNGTFQAISGHFSETVPCQIRWKSLTLDDLERRYAFAANGAR